jgi:rSAM/selenodomain-associated transferase 1
LAATIGDEQALKVYQLLLEKTKHETVNLNLDKLVYYSDHIDNSDLWKNQSYDKEVQVPGNLGIKMASAFEKAFQDGYQRVCIIGSDCYEMSQAHLESAFKMLKSNDAVIGPAEDGGYYTIGMSRFIPELFENKAWSTDTVGADTIKNFENLALSYEVLPTLNDVDTEGDLGPWADAIIN